MEDAEENKAFGAEGIVRETRHQQGSREEDGEPAEIGTEMEAVPGRHHQVDADEEDECAGDPPGEQAPAEIAADIGGNQLVIAEVPRQVVGHHRDDRDALQDIDGGNARPAFGGGAGSGRGCGHGSQRRSRHLSAFAGILSRRAQPDATANRTVDILPEGL